MPRYTYRGGRGVRTTTVLRLARPTERGCTCAPAFIVSRRARGTEITYFNPFRYVTVLPVFQDTLRALRRRNRPAAKALPDCAEFPSASNPFQYFQHISPHRAMRFPVGRTDHRQQRAKRVPCAFFSVAPYRTAPAVRPSGECTAVVETDRDFAEDSPAPYSPFDHPEPYDIFLIGNGRLRGYGYRRTPRRKGSR